MRDFDFDFGAGEMEMCKVEGDGNRIYEHSVGVRIYLISSGGFGVAVSIYWVQPFLDP